MMAMATNTVGQADRAEVGPYQAQGLAVGRDIGEVARRLGYGSRGCGGYFSRHAHMLPVPWLQSRKKARNERSPPRDSSPEVMNFALRPLRIQGAKSAELPQG